MSKRTALILFLSVSLVVIGAFLLLAREPAGGGPWTGGHAFTTTTPTMTLLSVPESNVSPILSSTP